jgi:hypothetical protein
MWIYTLLLQIQNSSQMISGKSNNQYVKLDKKPERQN